MTFMITDRPTIILHNALSLLDYWLVYPWLVM